MRWVGLGIFSSFMVFAAVCILTSRSAYNLPSRPPTGNHGQGQSPARGRCPEGTREFWVDTEQGSFFLECQR